MVCIYPPMLQLTASEDNFIYKEQLSANSSSIRSKSLGTSSMCVIGLWLWAHARGAFGCVWGWVCVSRGFGSPSNRGTFLDKHIQTDEF